MSEKLVVVPQLCSGCSICELVCAIKHFGANNPKKSAIRVQFSYPRPAGNKPVVCSQCEDPSCAEACPTDALESVDGVVQLDEDKCIYCFDCVEACPFEAMYVHRDSGLPIKCDMCGGDPECVKKCPKDAVRLVPEAALGQLDLKDNVLSEAQIAAIDPR
jgi:Fe-S-cluster-containing hydrogenase component 2